MNELDDLLEKRSMGRATYQDLKRIDFLRRRAFWLGKFVALKPGKMELGVLFGSVVAGVLSSADDRALGVLAGAVLALLFWGMFVLIVGVSNFGFLPRQRRAPVAACVVAPFTTGFTLLLLSGWPGARKV
ncbi:hypothetical protein [Pseudomonas sp. F1002]|uniref:hypothetical protein n=1 Tax=Pseudomonas sp. F1002 TaxID=2738821 RepID=UPI0015A4600C|nr:hypothetical protein [Pseudomonas sp. F1002]NWB63549.1 hypothetical protein [Pseudomonas sp. F1002]